MNEKEAIDVCEKSKSIKVKDAVIGDIQDYCWARGYLEALEKAKEMERVIRKHMSCTCNPQNDITCVRCDTLRQWEKVK